MQIASTIIENCPLCVELQPILLGDRNLVPMLYITRPSAVVSVPSVLVVVRSPSAVVVVRRPSAVVSVPSVHVVVRGPSAVVVVRRPSVVRLSRPSIGITQQ